MYSRKISSNSDTYTVLKKKFFIRFRVHKLHLKVVAWSKVFVMSSIKKNAYQRVFDFEEYQSVVSCDCCL